MGIVTAIDVEEDRCEMIALATTASATIASETITVSARIEILHRCLRQKGL
jgi:hypothetical protein